MSEIPSAMEAGLFRQVAPVLVVDDDTDWGMECAFALRQMGYEPFVASNADEAQALFRTHDISIAIVDYNLPGLDGIALIRELSRYAEEQERQLRFIIATGHATKDIAIDAMRASAADFLEKPISPVDLRRALQRVQGLPEVAGERKVLLERMSQLSSELQRLAGLIDEPVPSENRNRQVDDAPPSMDGATDPAQLKKFIKELLRKETKRREIGGGELFGDPAWAMLLDLLLAKIETRRVSVSSACIASGAPMSTALRLVRRLVDEDVLCRLPDEQDKRRHFLIINPRLEQPLLGYLTEQLRTGG